MPVHVASGLSPEAARAYRLADNRTHDEAYWNPEGLGFELHELSAAGFDLALTGFDPAELPFQLPGEQPASADGAASEQQSRTLAERFGIPPFSVFNAREGWWQDRKRAWIELGIRSELGRGAPIGGAPMPIDRAKPPLQHRDARWVTAAGCELLEIESTRRRPRPCDATE